jgi:formylglycine-generating enzyme required for sulfatase activity
VLIPAGPFEMGSDPGVDRDDPLMERIAQVSLEGSAYAGTEAAEKMHAAVRAAHTPLAARSAAERPVHRVSLDAFRIDRHPLRLSQFEDFLRATGADSRRYRAVHDYRPDPFVLVTFDDAVACARWAGRRLPTEAEWEKAMRAGVSGKIFPCGDVDPGDLERAGRTSSSCGTIRRQPGEENTSDWTLDFANSAGLLVPRRFGGEWCSDWYDPAYYQHSPAHDPAGPTSGTHRVVRGEGMRCGRRGFDRPDGLAMVRTVAIRR